MTLTCLCAHVCLDTYTYPQGCAHRHTHLTWSFYNDTSVFPQTGCLPISRRSTVLSATQKKMRRKRLQSILVGDYGKVQFRSQKKEAQMRWSVASGVQEKEGYPSKDNQVSREERSHERCTTTQILESQLYLIFDRVSLCGPVIFKIIILLISYWLLNQD